MVLISLITVKMRFYCRVISVFDRGVIFVSQINRKSQSTMTMLALKLHVLQLQHALEVQRRRQELRSLRRFVSVSQHLDREFVATYRLTKGLAYDLIQEVKPYVPYTRGDLTVERKVLICLGFLATGSDQRSVGQAAAHGFSQPSVSRAIRQVVEALNHPTILKKYIVFPKTREARNVLKRRFYEDYGLPGVVAAVDGTHVGIHRPHEGEDTFFNRKHFHSLNVQVICDADLNILSVDASHGGSTHDCVMWGDHPLNGYLQSLHASGETLWLLGDSGYPQRETMMTPIINAAAGSAEAHYTELHVRARNTVERCFGVLKARWRCLSSARKLHYAPVMAAKIVNACAVLHNIAHGANLQVPPLEPHLESEERRVVAELEARQDSADVYLAAVPAPHRRQINVDLVRGRAARALLVQSLQT